MQYPAFTLAFDIEEPPPTRRENSASVRVELVSAPFYGARVDERLLDARDPRVEPDDVPTHRSPQLHAAPQSGTRLVASSPASPGPKPARSSMVVPCIVDVVDVPKKAKRRRRRRRAA